MRKLILLLSLGVCLAGQGYAQEEGGEVSLSGLKFEYEVLLAEERKPVDQLDDFYEAKLKELEQSFQDEGNLAKVLPVRKEIESFREEVTEIQPPNNKLKRLQEIYLDARKSRYPEYAREASLVLQEYQGRLETLVTDLTKAGKLEDALSAKEAIETAGTELARIRGIAEKMDVGDGRLVVPGRPDWGAIEKIFEDKNWEVATETAGDGGGSDYVDFPDGPGILIGMELQYSDFKDHETVRGVRGIYLTEKGRQNSSVIHGFQKGRGRKVIAKDGYALGGLDVFGDSASIRRAKLTFYRIQGDRLDPNDKYESDWHGEYEVGAFYKSFSDGRPLVGFRGLEGLGLGSIQFYLGGE